MHIYIYTHQQKVEHIVTLYTYRHHSFKDSGGFELVKRRHKEFSSWEYPHEKRGEREREQSKAETGARI